MFIVANSEHPASTIIGIIVTYFVTWYQVAVDHTTLQWAGMLALNE
jgi:hypothetical protein